MKGILDINNNNNFVVLFIILLCYLIPYSSSLSIHLSSPLPLHSLSPYSSFSSRNIDQNNDTTTDINNNNNNNNNSEYISILVSEDSRYSTLGHGPRQSIIKNVTFLFHDELGNDCTFKTTKPLRDRFLVYQEDIFWPPIFKNCITDDRGNGVALAKMAQEEGVAGIVVYSTDSFLSGRITGFADFIYVPFLVVDKKTINFLFKFSENVSALEFPVLSDRDHDWLGSLNHGYKVWVILNAVLYGILLVLLGYLVYVEILSIRSKHKKFSHGMVIKSTAFIITFFMLLWHCIDPFSFKAKTKWPSGFFITFPLGLVIVMFTMILRIWVRVTITSQFRTGVLGNLSLISKILYTCGGVVAFISFLNGIVWWNMGLKITFEIVCLVLLVICGFGFIFYGKSILMVFFESGRKHNRSFLSIKISAFLITFVVIGYITVVIDVMNAMGSIYGCLFDTTVAWFGMLLTFLILFFRGSEKKRKIPTTNSGTPPSHNIKDSNEISITQSYA